MGSYTLVAVHFLDRFYWLRKRMVRLRFCIDYRALNEATIKDRFQFRRWMIWLMNYMEPSISQSWILGPNITKSESIRRMYTRLHFELIMGITNTWWCPLGCAMHHPHSRQPWMLFKPLLRKFILVFFNDILIYSRSWEVHLEHIWVVFKILQNQQFFLNALNVNSDKLRWISGAFYLQGRGTSGWR